MRAVIQRVRQAEVIVSGESVGKIGHGLLVFLGVEEDDTNDELEWMVNKILKLRIFEDEEEKMNLSVQDVEGELLVVSQFTLCADTRKGTRPSFIKAAKPDKAEPMYEDAVKRFKASGLNVETGEFGAMMDVHLHNDGPVTLILDR